MGGEVPRSFYMRKNPPVAKDYMEMLSISAGIGGKKKLEYDVDATYSIIRYIKHENMLKEKGTDDSLGHRWEFMTDGGDISYRVYNKNTKNNSEDLVPHCRVDSHQMMEEGQVTCVETGKCNWIELLFSIC